MQGHFPRSWRNATRLQLLDVSNNPELDGCMPLTNITMILNDTHITRECSTNTVAAEQARLQRQALLYLLPKVVAGTTASTTGFNQMVQEILVGTERLGQLVGDGDTKNIIWATYKNWHMALEVEVIDVVEFLTHIRCEPWITGDSLDCRCAPAIYLTSLVQLMKALPHVQTFACNGCNAHPAPGNVGLLSGLANTSLQTLMLPDCNLTGRLPQQWDAWGNIQPIDLSGNKIVGALPPNWAALAHLTALNLTGNRLQGRLPNKWGKDKAMP
jgi:hypothetical protein